MERIFLQAALFQARAGREHNEPLSLSAGIFSASPWKGPREQTVTPAKPRVFAATTKRLKISQRAAGSPAWGWLLRGSCRWLSLTPQPPSWGLGAQQVLPQHRGDWEVLMEEPGPVCSMLPKDTRPWAALWSQGDHPSASSPVSLPSLLPFPATKGRRGGAALTPSSSLQRAAG